MQQNGQLNYGVVTSLPKSNSLNETILFPTTTRIQTASILTEFDENPDLKHAVGQPKRWELCWGFSVKAQTATNALVSGKPRTPIPGECGALVGDFIGFGLSLLPRYAGFSTAFGASIGERGP